MRTGKQFIAIAVSAALFGATAMPAFAASELTKDETVYVVTEPDGSQKDVTVSDHLINESDADQIQDVTNLKDIENVKGEETFEKGEGDAILWQAGGNDIFYDGTTDKQVPVQIGVSYFLNGEEVQGSELEGASGDVKIMINYRNTARDKKGNTVPFIAMTAFIAEDDTFTDIEVDQGKVIDDGDKQIVAAIAAPGLSEALNIDKDIVDLDLNDTVTITGTAKKFNTQDMMTLVLNSVFEDVDTDAFGDMDYDDKISELDKGAKELMSGSKKLYDGISTLNSKMPALKDGVGALSSGADELSDGTDDALKGSKKLNKGAKKLSRTLTSSMENTLDGITKLRTVTDAVLDGLEQLKSGLDDARDALQKANNSLKGAMDNIDKVKNSLTTAKTGSSDVEQYLEDLNKEFDKISAEDKAKLKAKGFDVSLIDKVDGKITEQKAVESALSSATGDKGLKEIRDDVEGASSVVDIVVGDESSGLIYAVDVLGEYDPSLDKQTTLIGAETVLDDGLETMYDKLSDATAKDGSLTKGLAALVTGTKTMQSGEVKLAGGSKQLARGMDKLEGNTQTLSSGVGKLDSGSLELSKGMTTLYDKGIRKIVDLYNDDLKGSLDDLEDLIDAGQSYDTFTKLPKGAKGSVKFLYKTSVY